MNTEITADATIVTISIPVKDPALTKRASSLTKIAERMVIDSPAMLGAAGDDLVSVKSLQKKLEEQRDSEVRPLNSKVKEINDEYREPKQWLADAESVLKQKIMQYQEEQARIAAEAQRKADELARIERQRLHAEAQAQQEEANRQFLAARKLEAERQAAEQRAKDAEAAGNAKAAEAARAEAQAAIEAKAAAEVKADEATDAAATTAMTAEIVTAPAIVSQARKVAGLSTSRTWKARVENLGLLLAFIADHPECHDWVDVKMTPLNGMAKALKDNMQVPGVVAYEDKTMSARAA